MIHGMDRPSIDRNKNEIFAQPATTYIRRFFECRFLFNIHTYYTLHFRVVSKNS